MWKELEQLDALDNINVKCFEEVLYPCAAPIPIRQYNLFVRIPDSGSIFKVRSHNCLVEKSKSGVIRGTR